MNEIERTNDPTQQDALRMAENVLLAISEQWDAKALPGDFFLLPHDLGETVSTVRYAIDIDSEKASDTATARKSQTGPETPTKPWPVIFCEGGLVQSVVTLWPGTTRVNFDTSAEYEVMDYDVLEDQSSEDIAEYFFGRTPELREYMRLYLCEEYKQFMDEIDLAEKIKQDKLNPPKKEPTPEEQLLEASRNALNSMKAAQEAEDGPVSMPWPQIDALDEAIKRVEEAKK